MRLRRLDGRSNLLELAGQAPPTRLRGARARSHGGGRPPRDALHLAAALSSTAPRARRRSSTAVSAFATDVSRVSSSADLTLSSAWRRSSSAAPSRRICSTRKCNSRALLAMLELLDRRANLSRPFLGFPAALGYELGHGVGGIGGREQPRRRPLRGLSSGARPGHCAHSRSFLACRCIVDIRSSAPATHPQPSSSEWPPAPARISPHLHPLLPEVVGGLIPMGEDSCRFLAYHTMYGCNRCSTARSTNRGGVRIGSTIGSCRTPTTSFGPATAEAAAESSPAARSSWSGSAASTAIDPRQSAYRALPAA